MKDDKVYTHDEAAMIIEMFEHVLDENDITIPSPEDDEREADNAARLYGSTYYELLDNVEVALINLLNKHNAETDVIRGLFSGTV